MSIKLKNGKKKECEAYYYLLAKFFNKELSVGQRSTSPNVGVFRQLLGFLELIDSKVRVIK